MYIIRARGPPLVSQIEVNEALHRPEMRLRRYGRGRL